jgi:GMP synthase-like glutamine amidotransferase
MKPDLFTKPIAIFRFSATEGPGYFATFLDRHSVPWQLIKLDEGDAVPTSLDPFSGFVFMGGPMSVNDDLPWIPEVLQLIRNAIAKKQPCLGHCLGGQLISKALGGVVSKNAVKEIGWQPVRVEDSPIARTWLGDDLDTWTTFQWHGETFTIPHGATRILSGDACINQAYVIGNSLGMQCHVEMTPQMIETWARDWEKENADPASPSVQRPEEMLAAMEKNLVTLNKVADRLYEKWLSGLTRSQL